jgi:hypothetical protein
MRKRIDTKIFLLFFLIAITTALGFSEEPLIKSSWRSLPLNIDGSPGDWTDVSLSSADKIALDYAFMNDAENLFVIVEFTDRKDMSSINYTGLTMWFNTEGKKKKHYGITFKRKQVTADFYLNYLAEQGQQVSAEDEQKIRAMSSIIFYDAAVTNKQAKSEAQPAADQEIKPAVFRQGSEKRMMVYELSIPLARAADMAPGIGSEPGQTVKVCFEWGGMTDELRKQMRDKQIGRAGSSSGVADSNPRGGIGVPRQGRTPKKYSVWIDLELAKNE